MLPMVGGGRWGGGSDSSLSTHRSLSFGTILWNFPFVGLMSSGFYHPIPAAPVWGERKMAKCLSRWQEQSYTL